MAVLQSILFSMFLFNVYLCPNFWRHNTCKNHYLRVCTSLPHTLNWCRYLLVGHFYNPSFFSKFLFNVYLYPNFGRHNSCKTPLINYDLASNSKCMSLSMSVRQFCNSFFYPCFLFLLPSKFLNHNSWKKNITYLRIC